MKVVLINDTHFGARGSSSIFFNFFEKFYRDVFFKYIDDHGITTIIHLGDVVDKRKSIDYVALSKMRSMFIEPIIERNIDFHVIVGNHDVPYRNTNSLNAINELFKGYENLSIYSEPKTTTFDGRDILLVPWINPENREDCLRAIRDTDSKVCFGHFELAGFQMHRGSIVAHGMDSGLLKKFVLVASGHYHHRSTSSNINYLGCPYEMTWADCNDPKGFHVFDTESMTLEFIENPYKMFYKAVYRGSSNNSISDIPEGSYVKIVVEGDSDTPDLNEYINELNQKNLVNLQVVDRNISDVSEIENVDDVDDTLGIIKSYISGLDTVQDKITLEQVAISLYNESLEL
jgi:DNA repair exonuclease SbcCD nuclease subunit